MHFSSACAETQRKIQGILSFPNLGPSFHFPFLGYFPLASLHTSTPFKPPLPLLTLLACRNGWRVEMKLIGSNCRKCSAPPVVHCCVRWDWHTLTKNLQRNQELLSAAIFFANLDHHFLHTVLHGIKKLKFCAHTILYPSPYFTHMHKQNKKRIFFLLIHTICMRRFPSKKADVLFVCQ